MDNLQSFQVIEKSYMRSVFFRCALVVIAGLLLTGGIFYLMIHQPIGPTYGKAFSMLARLQQEILYKSIVVYACTVFVMLLGIVVITVLYSHRVAGPVFRLTQFVRKMREGELSHPVSIRQRDVIQPLAQEVNEMMEGYRQKIICIRKELDAIEKGVGLIQDGDALTDHLARDIENRAGEIFRITSKLKL